MMSEAAGSILSVAPPFGEIGVLDNLLRSWRKFLDAPYCKSGIDQCVEHSSY